MTADRCWTYNVDRQNEYLICMRHKETIQSLSTWRFDLANVNRKVFEQLNSTQIITDISRQLMVSCRKFNFSVNEITSCFVVIVVVVLYLSPVNNFSYYTFICNIVCSRCWPSLTTTFKYFSTHLCPFYAMLGWHSTYVPCRMKAVKKAYHCVVAKNELYCVRRKKNV